jgi:hypothetical protein
MCKADSWMLFFGQVGSSWGHRTFFGSLWREKVITLFFLVSEQFGEYCLLTKQKLPFL